ncbi:MAG TPA: glycosyltransferase family 8 protein [Haloplasmataceae bacterium]
MKMNILVTLDSNYLYPLKVMLKSMFFHHPNDTFNIYVMHSRIKPEEIEDLKQFAAREGSEIIEVKIGEEHFADAPLLMHYTKEMYYRLLAFKFLPKELDRILYLDPDILVINSVKPLYTLDITGYLYAAAYRNQLGTAEVNKIRLKPYDIDAYYNSGVLLMNLALQRQYIDEEKIFEFVKKYHWKLILPDQDVMNALFARLIYPLDEKIYNYDVRKFRSYRTSSKGKFDMDYVIKNTVFLHFCGKKKPWHPDYRGRFHALYKHYEKLAFPKEEVVEEEALVVASV